MIHLGVVTYGEFEKTRAGLEQFAGRQDIYLHVVVGDPSDKQTGPWVKQNFPYYSITLHEKNFGFPSGLNDIMDEAFGFWGADYVIFMGSDVIPYPGALELLVRAYEQNWAYEWYGAASEVRVAEFVKENPWAWTRDPSVDWLEPLAGEPVVTDAGFVDTFHNFALLTREYFEAVGYVDVNFFPAYFEDWDYFHRGLAAGMRHGVVSPARYLHHKAATTEAVGVTDRFYPLNQKHFEEKWGAPGPGVVETKPWPGEYGERSREAEESLIERWRWSPLGFKDLHKGKTAVIVGSGPSLNNVDLSLLENVTTIGLNRSYLKEGLRLDYLVCVNNTMLEEVGEDIVSQPAKAIFIPNYFEKLWRNNVYGLSFDWDVKFGFDLEKPIYQGHSVLFVALQLAYYMGFTNVILVGCDARYPDAVDMLPDQQRSITAGSQSHFTSEYWEGMTKWEAPNSEATNEAILLAMRAYVDSGRFLVNATPGSLLPHVSYMSLEAALALVSTVA